MTQSTSLSRVAIVAALIAITFVATTNAQGFSYAQVPGIWHIVVNTGINRSNSETMSGAMSAYASSVSADYSNAKYPFGQGSVNIGAGAMITYQPAYSPGAAMVSVRMNSFNNSQSASNATMNIYTLTVGGEYGFGDYQSLFNLFVHLGGNASFISGQITTGSNSTIQIPRELRYGAEAGAGLRVNIPGTKFSLEAATDYVNANLLGKKYTTMSETPNKDMRPLNDGRNPFSPDAERVIDYLSMRVGVGVWF